MERKGIVSFKGNGLTLVGEPRKIGDRAPDFTALDKYMKPVKLSDFKGEIVVISGVPSLDTQVCELQTIRFNQEAARLNAKILTISMDLPFAQARFCSSYNVNNVIALSDFKEREFSHAYGLYMKELGLVARSVHIIDRDGLIAYQQIVSEMSEQPDYDDVLAAARRLGA